jgi:integrase
MSSTNSTASGFVELSTHSGSKKKGNWKPRPRGPVYFLRYRVPDASRDSGVREVKENLGKAWTKKGRPAEGYVTAKMAEDALSDRLTDARRGLGKKGSSGATFGQACAEFLRFVRVVRKIDPKTAKDYEGVINGYLLKEFGADTPAEDVDPDKVDAYKERLIEEDKLSNRTIVRHLTVGTGVYKRAKRKWGVKVNPFAAELVERPPVDYTGEFDTYDRDEVELLAANADSDQDAAIFRTAAYTGLRQGELLALRWKWVDFVDGLLHVRRNFTGGEEKVPKGKKVRSVPMMPDVISTLAKLKERDDFTGDDDLVFVNEVGSHVDHYELRKRFYAATEKAGLRRIKFHDLRHAFGTAAVKKLDPLKVQGYMGHKHYSTTQRYLHHKPRREDAAALAEAFGAPAPEHAEATERKAA